MGYFLLVVLIIIFIFAGAGLYLAINVAHNKKRPEYDIYEYDYSWHDEEYNVKIKNWIKTLDLNYVKVRSPYLYKLNILAIKNNNNNKWVMILHGVTMNHKAYMDMAYMYSKLGYNVLMWDSRNHGESEGKNISYGYYEKHDLKAVIDYMRREYGEKIKIGLHGVSMGSGILLSYATAVRDDCEFYAADCPYSNMYRQVFDVAKRTIKMPDFIIKIFMAFAKFFLRLLFKFDIGKIDIAGKMHRMENPVLIINCRNDDYIDPAMSQELYDKCSSEVKKIVWFDEGGHGGAFAQNREDYISAVNDFLEEIEF